MKLTEIKTATNEVLITVLMGSVRGAYISNRELKLTDRVVEELINRGVISDGEEIKRQVRA